LQDDLLFFLFVRRTPEVDLAKVEDRSAKQSFGDIRLIVLMALAAIDCEVLPFGWGFFYGDSVETANKVDEGLFPG
jgi:hypothetical protein